MRIFGFGSEEVGRLAIPGETELDLPEGKVKLRYQQKRESVQRAPMGLPDLDLTIVSAAGGEPLTVTPPRGSSTSSSPKVQSKPVGSIEVPAAGRYRVTITNSVDRADPFLIVQS